MRFLRLPFKIRPSNWKGLPLVRVSINERFLTSFTAYICSPSLCRSVIRMLSRSHSIWKSRPKKINGDGFSFFVCNGQRSAIRFFFFPFFRFYAGVVCVGAYFTSVHSVMYCSFGKNNVAVKLNAEWSRIIYVYLQTHSFRYETFPFYVVLCCGFCFSSLSFFLFLFVSLLIRQATFPWSKALGKPVSRLYKRYAWRALKLTSGFYDPYPVFRNFSFKFIFHIQATQNTESSGDIRRRIFCVLLLFTYSFALLNR